MLQWLKGRAVLIMHDTKDATIIALPLVLDWIAFENRRRSHRGLRPIRIIAGDQVAAEQVAPDLAWLRRASTELAAELHAGFRSTLLP